LEVDSGGLGCSFVCACGLLLALFLETEFILNSILMTHHCFSVVASCDCFVGSGDDLSVCKDISRR
jgi:hypothetical protein